MGWLLILAACATACLTLWGIAELVAYLRWQRFLKLLDERLSDRADGSRLTAPDDFKVLRHGQGE